MNFIRIGQHVINTQHILSASIQRIPLMGEYKIDIKYTVEVLLLPEGRLSCWVDSLEEATACLDELAVG